jgi:hypothetical protein
MNQIEGLVENNKKKSNKSKRRLDRVDSTQTNKQNKPELNQYAHNTSSKKTELPTGDVQPIRAWHSEFP